MIRTYVGLEESELFLLRYMTAGRGTTIKFYLQSFNPACCVQV